MLLPAGRRPATDATLTMRSRAARAKMTGRGAREEERSAQVHVLDAIPDVHREAVEIAERHARVPAGVVDEDVEPAELGDHRIHCRRDRGCIVEIELNHRRAPPTLGDPTAGLDGAVLVVDPRDGDVRAGVGQRQRDRATEIARAASDQRCAAVEVHASAALHCAAECHGVVTRIRYDTRALAMTPDHDRDRSRKDG